MRYPLSIFRSNQQDIEHKRSKIDEINEINDRIAKCLEKLPKKSILYDKDCREQLEVLKAEIINIQNKDSDAGFRLALDKYVKATTGMDRFEQLNLLEGWSERERHEFTIVTALFSMPGSFIIPFVAGLAVSLTSSNDAYRYAGIGAALAGIASISSFCIALAINDCCRKTKGMKIINSLKEINRCVNQLINLNYPPETINIRTESEEEEIKYPDPEDKLHEEEIKIPTLC